MPESATIRFDTSKLTDPKLIQAAVDIAVRGGHTAAQNALEERLTELEAAPPAPAPAPAPALTAPLAKLLDQPISALFELDHRELDVILRSTAKHLGVDYVTALERVQDTAERLGDLFKPSGPDSVGTVLRAAGVSELDAWQDDVRLLDERDDAVQRQLDADSADVNSDQLNASGQVLLDADFDVARLLHDGEALERRYRHARELDSRFHDRATWQSEDLLYLDSGVDLLRTLDRPARIAQAQQGAMTLARQLDSIIEADQTASARTRELTAAIDTLSADRENVTTSTSQVKELAQGEPPTTLSDLTAAQIPVAVEMVRAKTHTLEQAIPAAAGFELEGGNGEKPYTLKVQGVSNTPPDAAQIENLVGEYMQLHPGTPYSTAVTNVVADLHGSW